MISNVFLYKNLRFIGII